MNKEKEIKIGPFTPIKMLPEKREPTTYSLGDCVFVLESELIEAERTIEKMQATIDGLAAAMAEMWPFIEEDYYPNCVTAIFDSAVKKYKAALDSVKTESP